MKQEEAKKNIGRHTIFPKVVKAKMKYQKS
jgi:hypothetical protein